MVDHSHAIEACIFAALFALVIYHEYEKRKHAREKARKAAAAMMGNHNDAG